MRTVVIVLLDPAGDAQFGLVEALVLVEPHNRQFPVIASASKREGVARSSPANDPSVASFSSHIRKQFRTVGISDSDDHQRQSVAR